MQQTSPKPLPKLGCREGLPYIPEATPNKEKPEPMNTNTLPRPRRRALAHRSTDRRQSRRDLPIPYLPTIAGYALPWPSGRATEKVEKNQQPAPVAFVCPADVPAHQFCSTCGLANLHGPRCYGHDCPRRITR